MNIKNTQELSKVITLCRKKGVESFKISENGVEIKLGPAPTAQKRNSKAKDAFEEATEDRQGLTAEQVLFWSSSDIPMNAEGN